MTQNELNVFRRIPWQEVCKFLAGGFSVNTGILFYLYLARVSVPLWGTGFIETPEVSGVRSIEAIDGTPVIDISRWLNQMIADFSRAHFSSQAEQSCGADAWYASGHLTGRRCFSRRVKFQQRYRTRHGHFAYPL